MRLRHRRLVQLAERLEQTRPAYARLDLYAAQGLLDQMDTSKLEAEARVLLHSRAFADFLLACSCCTRLGFVALPLSGPLAQNLRRQLAVQGLYILSRSDEISGEGIEGIGDGKSGNEPGADGIAPILNLLRQHGLLTDASDAGEVNAPLIFWRDRIYLRRLWRPTQRLQQWLDAHRRAVPLLDICGDTFLNNRVNCAANSDATGQAPESPESPLSEYLVNAFKSLFPDLVSDRVDWQAVATLQALTQTFTLISGGPGTGKTSTAARILVLLKLQFLLQRSGSARVQGPEQMGEQLDLPVVRLLAPTGKAAVRLYAAIQSQYQHLLAKLSLPNSLKQALRQSFPAAGETIHRALLGVPGALGSDSRPVDLSFVDAESLLLGQQRHGQLRADIVLIDEASMIDLVLMDNLLAHLPEVKLVLMGDHFQLPPVDPGEVFADWVSELSTASYTHAQRTSWQPLLGFDVTGWIPKEADGKMVLAGTEPEPPPRLLCQLLKTYRFSGPIFEFAQALRSDKVRSLPALLPTLLPEVTDTGRASSVADLLGPPAMQWIDLDLAPEDTVRARQLGEQLARTLHHYAPYFSKVNESKQGESKADESKAGVSATVLGLAQEKANFQILCASYAGPLGVHAINRLLEQRFCGGRELYTGKVIMVTANQPKLNLFNGDVGFVQKVSVAALASNSESGPADNGELFQVVFPDKAGRPDSATSAAGESADPAALFTLPLSLIHEWQTAYAISIHKSQGSEYRHVAVVVPDYARELVSRRLVYTGITRSQQAVELWIGAQSLSDL